MDIKERYINELEGKTFKLPDGPKVYSIHELIGHEVIIKWDGALTSYSLKVVLGFIDIGAWTITNYVRIK